MKKCMKYLFILTVVCFSTISCMEAREPHPGRVGKAVDFTLQDLNDNSFSLNNYKNNKPVALLFWTTWCPYCRRELSAINDRKEELRNAGCELVAIDMGESRQVVERFLKNHDLNIQVLLDKSMSTAHAYRILGVPTYILVDKEGYIAYQGNAFPEGKCQELTSK